MLMLLENFGLVDDDKAILLPLEISHPALFTGRCHCIMATNVNNW